MFCSDMSGTGDKQEIFAFGLETWGFLTPGDHVEGPSYDIRFVGKDAEHSLDAVHGVIVASGMFEHFREQRSIHGSHTVVDWESDAIAVREKQLLRAHSKGCWVCFLLRDVDNGNDNVWRDTDLTKRFLNMFFREAVAHHPQPYIVCRNDAFKKYLDMFGIARTSFGNPVRDVEIEVLATQSDFAVAAEVGRQIFFVPCQPSKFDRAELVSLVKSITEAVLEYKRKNEIYLPAWLQSVEFEGEKALKKEILQTEEKLALLHEEAAKWSRYKGVLSTSGKHLVDLVVTILIDFFGLSLHTDEKFVEDTTVLDCDGNAYLVTEIKGVNAGVKRENINQVDSHRERSGLDAAIMGLLIINDFMSVESFEKRKERTVDAQILAHAQRLNVKILRTTALIDLMRLTESESQADRGKFLLQACLKADPLVGASQ